MAFIPYLYGLFIPYMPRSAEETEYIAFLQWFQKNYPGLYTDYWHVITPAVSGARISVYNNKMDVAAYIAVLDVLQAFYNQKHFKKI